MKYRNPLEFLMGVLAVFVMAAVYRSRRSVVGAGFLASLIVFAFATMAWSKPPQAPTRPPQAPPVKVTKLFGVCGMPGCDCGCLDGKGCNCRKAPTDELSKPYAKEWIAQGWVWHADLGYWTKPSPTTSLGIQSGLSQSYSSQGTFAPAPSFRPSFVPQSSPFQGFGGGGGFRSGGGSRGGC